MADSQHFSDVTMRDIAKQSGFSVATVSRALRDGPRISEKSRENGGKIPYQQGSDSMTWHVEIGRYVNQFENEEWADLAIRNQRPPDVFACPAAEETVRFGNYSHFGMNPVVGDHYSNSTQKSHFVIPNPARTILLADVRNCIRLLGLWDQDGRLAARHPGDTVNVL